MTDICKTCGLPKDICVCQEIGKEKQRIKIYTETKKFKKLATIVDGFGEGTDLKAIAKQLKSFLACGGTHKNNRIELQGDHRDKVKQALLKMNYVENQIDMH